MIIGHVIGLFFAALTIIIHYEALRMLSLRVVERAGLPRLKTLLTVFSIFLAHVIEVWLFAGGLYLGSVHFGLGELQGNFSGSVRDYAYFSAVVYTSLGFGDIFPVGELRTIVAYESVIGLLMMAWSAAFTFHFMQRHWQNG